jgi:hypothetical protein
MIGLSAASSKDRQDMPEQDYLAVQSELERLRKRVEQLEEAAVLVEPHSRQWTREYYLSYYATTGFFLGMIAAVMSLAFNVVGSLLVGQHPLQLIKVYLTFGAGEKALRPELESGLVLAIGCCLYIATGMLLGVPFQVVLSRFADKATLAKRLLLASALGLAIWIVNYYLLLSWMQPLLFGGNWIIRLVPWWVAALTHLVFAWTMAALYPLGTFEPYRVPSPEQLRNTQREDRR